MGVIKRYLRGYQKFEKFLNEIMADITVFYVVNLIESITNLFLIIMLIFVDMHLISDSKDIKDGNFILVHSLRCIYILLMFPSTDINYDFFMYV